jgi:hypothetical protein
MNTHYHTKEFTYTLRPDKIIAVNLHKNFNGNFDLGEAEKNLRLLDKVIGAKPKCLLLHFPNKYVKKEIMKEYIQPNIL